MPTVKFNGTLRPNEVFGSIFNMIMSQEVFADNIKGTFSDLVDMSRVDGGLYGDTKLYYAVDIQKSRPWAVNPATGKTDRVGLQNEANNLLALEYPDDPECQSISLDQFRIIKLTVDNYLTKRAFSEEGAFSSFISVITGMMRETKRVYDATTFNAFIGTDSANTDSQHITIDISDIAEGTTNAEKKAGNELAATRIAEGMANLMVDLKDISRDFNDYGYMRSYSGDELVAVWNSKQVNKIKYVDLPSIFHKDAVTSDIKFAEYVLPARYFGDKITQNGVSTGVERSMIEKDYTVSGAVTHCFAGDLIPSGANYLANEAYLENPNKALIIMHRRSAPFMSAFETGTNFFNEQSLTNTKFLIWGHNTLEHLYNYPMIDVKLKVE